MAGEAQRTCRIRLAQERREVVAVHIVAGVALDLSGGELYLVRIVSAPALL